jgi:hypothetical protein
MLLLKDVLDEMGTWCDTSTCHDYNTIMARVENEGLSFLTISLPNFCSDFERSLDEGRVVRSLFTGFRWRAGLPQFLGGFLELIFARQGGLLLDSPSIDAIQAVRQITLMFGKINLPCSDTRRRAAIREFVETDDAVLRSEASLSLDLSEDFVMMSQLLWDDVFSSVGLKVNSGELLPKHGPGATADRLVGNSKYEQSEWTEDLDEVFPKHLYLVPNINHTVDHVTTLSPGTERPVRVVDVPKTLKTPRIIAIEPTCMQYMQQAVKREIQEAIEIDDLASSFIGFRRQEHNQLLAKRGSHKGVLATLDLSEASDRVSNQHVRLLLLNHPSVAKAIMATRSRKADVPDHGIHTLAKFASMGSALCFPMEMLVFTTVIFLGIQEVLNRRLTREDIMSFRGSVRVYGDDIVVPVDFVSGVVKKLEDFGFLVNTRKSFWTGKFRESCGKEYYDGNDVSIVRVRHMLPTRRRHVTEIISAVSLRNQFFMAGMWRSAKSMDLWMERLIPFPAVGPTSPALGRLSSLGYDTQRMDDHLHEPQVKAMCVVAKSPISRLDGSAALMKVFLQSAHRDNPISSEESISDWFSNEPIEDEDHLTRAGRPDAVYITRRWLRAY